SSCSSFLFLISQLLSRSTLFPYTTLFRSNVFKNILVEMSFIAKKEGVIFAEEEIAKIISSFKRYPENTTSSMHQDLRKGLPIEVDRKSTRLNSSHVKISYAVFCLKKKNKK